MSKSKNKNQLPNVMNTQYSKHLWELKSSDDFFHAPWQMMHEYRNYAGRYAALLFVLSIPFFVVAVLRFMEVRTGSGLPEGSVMLLGCGCFLLFFALRFYQMAKRNRAEKELQAQKQKGRKKTSRK